MNAQDILSEQAVECGHCGNKNRMRVIGSGKDTTEEFLDDTQLSRSYECGTMYEICICPSCQKPLLIWGAWNEMMDEPGAWRHNRWLPDKNSRKADQLLEQHMADRKFMELAVAEARLSSKKPSDKATPPPFVGAVVAFGTRLVNSGHRSEFDLGEHAEYTVLERKLKDERIKGATVYTTLEPCTGRPSPHKIPCMERLKARKVERVVIGMLDPDRNIRGLGVLALRKANIQVDLFPPDLMAELEELNREFIADKERTSPNA